MSRIYDFLELMEEFVSIHEVDLTNKEMLIPFAIALDTFADDRTKTLIYDINDSAKEHDVETLKKCLESVEYTYGKEPPIWYNEAFKSLQVRYETRKSRIVSRYIRQYIQHDYLAAGDILRIKTYPSIYEEFYQYLKTGKLKTENAFTVNNMAAYQMVNNYNGDVYLTYVAMMDILENQI